MSRKDTGRRHHRGRRNRRKAGIISNIILVVAVVVFCVSGFQLLKIGKGYLDGRSEYEKVRDLAVTNPEEKEGFRVDFDALLEVNPDTVGWIRFTRSRLRSIIPSCRDRITTNICTGPFPLMKIPWGLFS